MTIKDISPTTKRSKPSWIYYVLVLLVIEKIVQHIFVTLAFYFNWADITSTVVVPARILMVLGALVAVLFVLSLWGIVRKQPWAITLVIFLALFDIVGEFVAQGKMGITITVSFLVATLLLVVGLLYRRYPQGR